MLVVDQIDVSYGPVPVLRDFNLEAHRGEVLCVMGRNGAGKTTLMKAIMGLLPVSKGEIRVGDVASSRLPGHCVADLGVGYIPQGRRLFSELTVAQNLEVGLMARAQVRGREKVVRDKVLEVFPRLKERLKQRAVTLSGGEQQMLATARALCLEPEYLLLDEPTEGLQPSMIESIRDVIVSLRDQGVGVILVEQKVEAVLSVADRVAFVETGQSRDVVDVEILRKDRSLLKAFVGV